MGSAVHEHAQAIMRLAFGFWMHDERDDAAWGRPEGGTITAAFSPEAPSTPCYGPGVGAVGLYLASSSGSPTR